MTKASRGIPCDAYLFTAILFLSVSRLALWTEHIAAKAEMVSSIYIFLKNCNAFFLLINYFASNLLVKYTHMHMYINK